MMVQQLTESTAAAERAKEAAEEDSKALREKLFKREQKLTSVTQERAEVQAQLAELGSEIKSISKKLEKSKANLKSSEESLKATRSELERVNSELKRVTEVRERLDADLQSTREQLSKLTVEHSAASSALEASTSESSHRAEAIKQLEEAVSAAQTRIEEMRNEFIIATKLTKQHNNELKTALAAETRKVAKLERELMAVRKSAATPSMGAAQARMPPSPAMGGMLGPSAGGALGTPMRAGGASAGSSASSATPTAARPTDSNNPFGTPLSGAAMASPGIARRPGPAGAASASAAGFATPPGVPRPGGAHAHAVSAGGARGAAPAAGGAGGRNLAPMGGGDMAETVKLLGTRLKDVLAEAEVAKEKVKMLEGIVRSLSDELADKKRLLKELTTSAAGGAVDDAAAMDTVRSAGSDPNMLQNLLQKAMSENARLKKDMKVLGAEVMNSQDKARKAEEECRKVIDEKTLALQQAQEQLLAAQQYGGHMGYGGYGMGEGDSSSVGYGPDNGYYAIEEDTAAAAAGAEGHDGGDAASVSSGPSTASAGGAGARARVGSSNLGPSALSRQSSGVGHNSGPSSPSSGNKAVIAGGGGSNPFGAEADRGANPFG